MATNNPNDPNNPANVNPATPPANQQPQPATPAGTPPQPATQPANPASTQSTAGNVAARAVGGVVQIPSSVFTTATSELTNALDLASQLLSNAKSMGEADVAALQSHVQRATDQVKQLLHVSA